MSGVLIETWSNRQLLVFLAILALCQLAFFLIGGLIAPRPAMHQTISNTICYASSSDPSNTWYVPRGKNACRRINNLYENSLVKSGQLRAENVVFAFQLPLPRDGVNLTMSRWFQTMLGILQPNIAYEDDDDNDDDGGTSQKEKVPTYPLDPHAKLRLEMRIGYRNGGDDADGGIWHEIAKSNETRFLDCQQVVQQHKQVKHEQPMLVQRYSCAPLPLFELGSVHHEEYLLNIRIPQGVENRFNTHIGKLEEFELVEIHQTGGFSMVWYWTKTIMTPCVLAALAYFWYCVRGLPRRPVLLEKMLFALGLAMLQLCVPLEWLTLIWDMPYFMVLSDLRQGIFHSILMAFWIIFAGEHIMLDSTNSSSSNDKNRLICYWKHLSAVACGCLCLFVFDMCERGVQLRNPFHSIWSTNAGTKLGLTFIGLAAASAMAYFVFLCWMVWRVMRDIQAKKSNIHQMNLRNRQFYKGLIFRFQFLMAISVACAALTVTAFIMGQWAESQWKWGNSLTTVEADDSDAGNNNDDNDDAVMSVQEPMLEYTSSFFVGVFGMWCLYVMSLLILYSPCPKYYGAELLLAQSKNTATAANAAGASNNNNNTLAADDVVHEYVRCAANGFRNIDDDDDDAADEHIEFRALTPRTVAAAVRETDIVGTNEGGGDVGDDDDDNGKMKKKAIKNGVHRREDTNAEDEQESRGVPLISKTTAFLSKAAQD